MVQLNSNSLVLQRRWLLVSVLALAFAGLLALLLAGARTPGVQRYLPGTDFFHTALVVHVDLSVTVWFLGIAALIWRRQSSQPVNLLQPIAWWSFAIGTLLLAITPFTGDSLPLMNNYVPVLLSPTNPIFFFALGLILSGIALQWLALPPRLPEWENAVHWGIFASKLTVLVMLIHLALSLAKLEPGGHDAESYYNALFWAFGHVAQYAYVMLAMVAWLWLAERLDLIALNRLSWVSALFALGLGAVLATFVPYAFYAIDDSLFLRFFTLHMDFGTGTFAIPLLLYLLWQCWHGRRVLLPSEKPIIGALLTSLLLFAAGGLIALRIEGTDVTIPAHYHGSIVALTLAFMGLIYHLLPSLGYGTPEGRIAAWQPWIYAGGQLLHILGLMISGGYDVARKSLETGNAFGAKLGMGIMGLGGLISVIGGLLFVVVVWRAAKEKPHL